MSHSDSAIYEDAAREKGVGWGSRELQRPDSSFPKPSDGKFLVPRNRAPGLTPHQRGGQRGVLAYQQHSSRGQDLPDLQGRSQTPRSLGHTGANKVPWKDHWHRLSLLSSSLGAKAHWLCYPSQVTHLSEPQRTLVPEEG